MTKKGYVVGALVGLVLGIVLTTMLGGYFIKAPERITWTATQIQTLFSPTTVDRSIELYNPDPHDVHIGGWAVSTTHGETVTVIIPQDTWIPANGFHVVDNSRWLDNEGESIIPRSAAGRVADSTPNFDDTANSYKAWARVPNGAGT